MKDVPPEDFAALPRSLHLRRAQERLVQAVFADTFYWIALTNPEHAGAMVASLIDNPKITMVHQSHDSFMTGLHLYRARPDEGYNQTDCISMATMNRQGLTDVLTNDRHFEQEGFKALFRDRHQPKQIESPKRDLIRASGPSLYRRALQAGYWFTAERNACPTCRTAETARW